jgi:hypothetical protein
MAGKLTELQIKNAKARPTKYTMAAGGGRRADSNHHAGRFEVLAPALPDRRKGANDRRRQALPDHVAQSGAGGGARRS